MCEAKPDGGRRCNAHALKDFAASIASTRANKGERSVRDSRLLVTSKRGQETYDTVGAEKIASGTEKAAQAHSNVSALKALKEHRTSLAAASSTFDYDREYLTEAEKQEYSKLASDADRRQFFEVAKRDETVIVEQARDAWRADPNSYYDRASIPGEHASMIADKNVPEDYIIAIGQTTEDAATRDAAIQEMVRRGYTQNEAEATLPKSQGLLTAEQEAEWSAQHKLEQEAEVAAEKKAEQKSLAEKERKKKSKKKKRVNAIKRFFKSFW